MTQYIPTAPGDATHSVIIVGNVIYSPPLSSIFFGASGSITFLMAGDTNLVILSNVPAGTLLKGLLVQKVTNFTGTPASLRGFY